MACRARRVFRTFGKRAPEAILRTATGSELFSPKTCLHTATFTLLNIVFLLEMISVKIWETPLSWHATCSLPVAVRDSKTRALKLPSIESLLASLLPYFVNAFIKVTTENEWFKLLYAHVVLTS